MKTKTVFALMIVGALALCISVAQPALAASDEEEVLQVEINFAKAITTGDYELMSSLFWHSPKASTFHPSSRPFLCQGWEESLEPNWKSGLLPTGTTTVTPHNWQATFIKDDIAIITGYETVIDINETTNEQAIFNLRVTRVVQKIGGKWLIVHDHGSVLPTE